MNQPKKISLVFSVFNEKETLPALIHRVNQIIATLPFHFELIFIDDGSIDGSDQVIRGFSGHATPNVKIRLFSLSRNFGHEAAMIAGIDHASGDAVICMDADLQHPPEMIPEMIARFGEGNHIVTMIRSKNEGVSKRSAWFSRLFYRLINKTSAIRLQENASDFFLISQQVADILRNDFRERKRFLRGIIQTIGFPAVSLTYTAPARAAGKSKYSLFKLTTLSLNAITSFSKAPLYLGVWFGFFFALLSVILSLYSLWIYFFGVTPPSGYTTIILFLSISFSILFFLVGIIGIYVGYLFDEQKKRPIYIIKKTDSSENNPTTQI